MRKKLYVPDDAFMFLGFPLPDVSQAMTEAEELKNPKINFLNNNTRITSLKRTPNTYKVLLPKMKAFDLLKLSYNNVPENACRQSSYCLKVIKRFIKLKLSFFKDRDVFLSQGIPFLYQIIGVYKDSLSITSPVPYDSLGLSLAADVFNGSLPLKFEWNGHKEFPFFGVIDGTKKKKSSYYHYQAAPSNKFYMIDTETFLSYLCLYSCMHSLIKQQTSPLITHIFKEHYEGLVGKSMSETILNSLYGLIFKQEPIPFTCLFHIYQTKMGDNTYFSPDHQVFHELIAIFLKVLELFNDIQYECEIQKQLHKKIATAYITKKNIPKHIQKAMDDSTFHKYFGYVEYDEDIDLNAVKTIEKEFQELNRDYFSSLAFEEVSLRFRKLGKHKASGLYFPFLQTLCVDVRYPSSFIHEYFHMLDHQLDDLSLSIDFNHIVETYRSTFRNNMKSFETELLKQLNGKNQMNLKYFFRRTEIFARCGEIYMNRILKVQSSLLIPTMKFAYPESEKLDQQICIYYQKLLGDTLNKLKLEKVS